MLIELIRRVDARVEPAKSTSIVLFIDSTETGRNNRITI